MLISDVTPQTRRGREGILTLVAGKLLQGLRSKSRKNIQEEEGKSDVRLFVSAACSYLAVLFSHMANVDFPVLVALVTEPTLPP